MFKGILKNQFKINDSMTSDNVICRVRSYLPVCATPDAPIDMARRVYQEKMGVTLPRLSCGCGWVGGWSTTSASARHPSYQYKVTNPQHTIFMIFYENQMYWW